MNEKTTLVCAVRPTLPNTIAAACSECGATCYATRGSVEKARECDCVIICELCFWKMQGNGDVEIQGIMHNGKLLNMAELQEFVEDWFKRRARHERN